MRSISATGARRWILVILLSLAPLWLIGTLDRGAWTPDEPREADIAWRMSHQRDWVLPRLAGRPFLEKPPLSYWMSAIQPSRRPFEVGDHEARVHLRLASRVNAPPRL